MFKCLMSLVFQYMFVHFCSKWVEVFLVFPGTYQKKGALPLPLERTRRYIFQDKRQERVDERNIYSWHNHNSKFLGLLPLPPIVPVSVPIGRSLEGEEKSIRRGIRGESLVHSLTKCSHGSRRTAWIFLNNPKYNTYLDYLIDKECFKVITGNLYIRDHFTSRRYKSLKKLFYSLLFQ